MRQFKKPNRDQNYLLMSVNLDSVAPVGSALRSIDSLVEKLDTRKIEKKYDLKTPQGNVSLHPKTFIKVALWAMHSCRFSLRKIEDDTANNIGYKWLTGGEVIDHSTMGKFLASNPVEIEGMLAQVVMIGKEKDLLDFEILGTDTVKIRANASYKQFRTREGIEKEQEKIRKRIRGLMEKATAERTELEKKEHKILKRRQKRLEEAGKELARREEERQKKNMRINLTDKDSQLVQQANGETNAGYPMTVTVDEKADIITGFKMDEASNDAKNLFPALEESEKNTGEKHETIVADAGFSSMENLERIEKEDRKALIPDKRMEIEERGETKKGKYDRSGFKYSSESDRYRCPEGCWLKNIGAVRQNGRTYTRYANRGACAECAHRGECINGKSRYRIISRDTSEWLKENMRKELEKKRNKKIYKKRSHIAESPFGQMKQNLKYRIFMRRGKEKIGMEFSLLCMLHNMLKIAKKEFGYNTG